MQVPVRNRFDKAMAVLLALSLATVWLWAAAQAVTPETRRDIDDLRRYELAEHAQFGNVVVGRVVGTEGKVYGEPEFGHAPNPVLYYIFAVEETLRGDLSGEMRITYYGADAMTPESRGFGPLEVGKRYIISAGSLLADGTRPVSAGSGTILIKDPGHEARLVTQLTRMIRQDEGRRQNAVVRAIHEDTASSNSECTGADYGIDPAGGPPGIRAWMSGQGFFAQRVLLYWGETTFLDAARVDWDGTVRAKFRIPPDAQPGRHAISVVPEGGGPVIATDFTVTAPVAGNRFDAWRSAMGPDWPEEPDDATPGYSLAIADYGEDLGNERILMRIASHAFLGRVTAQVDPDATSADGPDRPLSHTEFMVEVLTTVKGELPDRVTVSQSGGIDARHGDLVIVNDDPLLQPGETAFFATTLDPRTGVYEIIGSGNGAVRTTCAAEQAAVLATFRVALRHPIFSRFDPSPGTIRDLTHEELRAAFQGERRTRHELGREARKDKRRG